MLNKKFSERLNKELDSIGVPEATSERIAILSKLIKVPKFKAEALLNGLTKPDAVLLKTLAEELEVTEDWLIGKGDSSTH
ncbi:MAG: hypothetical protein CK426_00815 [Legionella sp.]|nr:MAG: hypothetical protein CK423_02105 [Legionella sp.]PJE00081.1 MAG: hypothetical protein CK426_00815 [Legionella sp.]